MCFYGIGGHAGIKLMQVRPENRRMTLCFLVNKHVREFTPEHKETITIQMSMCKWELPPPGYAKVNFDASFINENQDGAFGFVATKGSPVKKKGFKNCVHRSKKKCY
jgi:hypothetical protein